MIFNLMSSSQKRYRGSNHTFQSTSSKKHGILIYLVPSLHSSARRSSLHFKWLNFTSMWTSSAFRTVVYLKQRSLGQNHSHSLMGVKVALIWIFIAFFFLYASYDLHSRCVVKPWCCRRSQMFWTFFLEQSKIFCWRLTRHLRLEKKLKKIRNPSKIIRKSFLLGECVESSAFTVFVKVLETSGVPQ